MILLFLYDENMSQIAKKSCQALFTIFATFCSILIYAIYYHGSLVIRTININDVGIIEFLICHKNEQQKSFSYFEIYNQTLVITRNLILKWKK